MVEQTLKQTLISDKLTFIEIEDPKRKGYFEPLIQKQYYPEAKPRLDTLIK